MASQTQALVFELWCSHEYNFVGKDTKSDVAWSAPGAVSDL